MCILSPLEFVWETSSVTNQLISRAFCYISNQSSPNKNSNSYYQQYHANVRSEMIVLTKYERKFPHFLCCLLQKVATIVGASRPRSGWFMNNHRANSNIQNRTWKNVFNLSSNPQLENSERYVGKIISQKPVNMNTIHSVLTHAWLRYETIYIYQKLHLEFCC